MQDQIQEKEEISFFCLQFKKVLHDGQLIYTAAHWQIVITLLRQNCLFGSCSLVVTALVVTTNKIIWFRASHFIFVGMKEQKWFQMNQSMDS